MTLAANWERQLIEKATIVPAYDLIAPLFSYSNDVMEQAYQYCAEITREHSKTFYLTSGLLSGKAQKATRALYAFCRVSDNLADEETEGRLAKLESWKQRSLSEHPPQDDSVPLAWADTRTRYGIPREYAEQLLEGVAQDLTKTRYKNFDELAHYCYGVASTVGLMTMHIIGFSGPEAIPYAIKLGVALQLTNILRDIGEDWEDDDSQNKPIEPVKPVNVDVANAISSNCCQEIHAVNIAMRHFVVLGVHLLEFFMENYLRN